jgi:translation initiation factor 1 (eIF-1/SUI1)
VRSRKEKTMTLTEFAKALAEQLESEGVTYEDLVQIQEEVKAEVREELEGADDE